VDASGQPARAHPSKPREKEPSSYRCAFVRGRFLDQQGLYVGCAQRVVASLVSLLQQRGRASEACRHHRSRELSFGMLLLFECSFRRAVTLSITCSDRCRCANRLPRAWHCSCKQNSQQQSNHLPTALHLSTNKAFQARWLHLHRQYNRSNHFTRRPLQTCMKSLHTTFSGKRTSAPSMQLLRSLLPRVCR
jgi:hypothetical protein